MPKTRSHGFPLRTAAVAAATLVLAFGARPARAQETMAQSFSYLRRGLGLRAGVWQLSTTVPDSARATQWPLIEVFYQRGMGRHLAMENSLGLFRRRVTAEAGTSLFGNTGTTQITSYIIPFTIGVDYFPFTRAGSLLEPFVRADVGFAIGVDSSRNSGTGPFGGSGGTSTSTGFGARGGAGLKLALGSRLALAVDANYMLEYFGADIGIGQSYHGPQFDAGLMYRLRR